MQVLAEIPAGRIWGLPFLTVLAPRAVQRGARPSAQDAFDWGRQMIRHCAAGCPIARRSWWRTAPMLPWSCWPMRHGPPGDGRHPPAARRRPLRPGATARTRDHGATTGRSASPPWRNACSIRDNRLGDADRPLVWWQDRPCGRGDRTAIWYHAGQPTVPLRLVLLRDPATPSRKPAQYRPDRRPRPVIVACSSPAGRWKSPSTKSALISASRPSGNGRTSPSCARPQLCSASSRS